MKLFFASVSFLLLSYASSEHASSHSGEDKTKCGYESCPATKKNMLNIHLVPHTHDDVGWLKTVDEYYYGSRPTVAKAAVQYIIDSVVEELSHDPAKRFIYVETSFFWKWWQEQHDAKRHLVKKLVSNGQLEFIGGGWSMNDEADTNYQSTIDQFTWGFRKLNDTFGECGRPKIGWQIDPFGHSRELASMMAQFGFDGLFIGRLDYQDKHKRFNEKKGEMIWQGSPKNLGKSSNLFTNVLFNNYSPPPTFCFDVLCNDEPIIDDKNSPKYNAEQRVKKFIELMETQKNNYSSNHLIVTMGEDFNYQDAHMWFKNLDKLIRLVNEKQVNGSEINLLYSTPSCYLKAVHEENLSYTVKDDDFFPYASDPHSFWTGYFTSRPTLKYYERRGNNFLQICKQLFTLTDIGPEEDVDLDEMRSAMGIMQHHDAITGTEKQQVAFDYARILSNGIGECEHIVDIALRKLIEKTPPRPSETYDKMDPIVMFTCSLLNISQCEVTESFHNFVVTLYNPLSRPATQYVRIPVPDKKSYSVLCPMGKEQVTQLVPLPTEVKNIPGRFSQANYELVFKARNLPPLGFRSYYVSQTNSSDMRNGTFMSIKRTKLKEMNSIGNPNKMSVVVDSYGRLREMTSKGITMSIAHAFLYYKGAVGDNIGFAERSSGAYIFRPNGSDPFIIDSHRNVTIYKGPIFDEFQVTFTNWASEIIRIYKDEEYVEFTWLVGPIPIEDKIGKEVISLYQTEIKSEGVFYTDSNGREILKRVRNHRPTWNVTLLEPVSGNYYPVTSKIVIKDDAIRLAVLTDRAQGGSSLQDGHVELMIHRRLLKDDAFGVDEALNETAFGTGLVARGSHYITIAGFYTEKLLAQQKLLDSWTFFTPAINTTFKDWSKNYNMEYNGLTKALPPNVQILTLEPWKGKSFLLRLEHIFEVDERPYSNSVTVDLQTLFTPFTIVSVQETTLGANLLLKNLNRMNWKLESNSIAHEDVPFEIDLLATGSNFTIVLKPMQIRTFIIEVDRKQSS